MNRATDDLGRTAAIRAELTRLLRLAARIEHGLLCQYLFAAFSLKRRHEEGGVTYAQLEAMRRWEARLLSIARQEMEHLGIVLNLRNAIGDPPDFVLPEFPFSDVFGDFTLRAELARFSRKTLIGFAVAEMPEKLDAGSADAMLLARLLGDLQPNKLDAIATLYDDIAALIEKAPEQSLFIGPKGAQLDTHDVFPGEIRGINLIGKPAYDVSLPRIDTKCEALSAIAQVKSEGEGADDHGGPDSHFGGVMSILRELVTLEEADSGFAPARMVVDNPAPDKPGAPGNVDHPASVQLMTAFESCNRAMLFALSRFFSFPHGDPAERAAIQQAAFFPVMTTIIRPLGEALTLMPAHATGKARAGASFGAGGPVVAPQERGAALRLIDEAYARAESILAALLDDRGCPGLDEPELRDRLGLVRQQIERARMNLSETSPETRHGL